jgi:hypothetical protein
MTSRQRRAQYYFFGAQGLAALGAQGLAGLAAHGLAAFVFASPDLVAAAFGAQGLAVCAMAGIGVAAIRPATAMAEPITSSDCLNIVIIVSPSLRVRRAAARHGPNVRTSVHSSYSSGELKWLHGERKRSLFLI